MQEFVTQYSISQLLYFADSLVDYLKNGGIIYPRQILSQDFQVFDFVENKYIFGNIKKKLKNFEQNNLSDPLKIVTSDLFVPISRNGFLSDLNKIYDFDQLVCTIPKLVDICKGDASIILGNNFQIGFWNIDNFVAITDFEAFERSFTGRIINALEIGFLEQEISGDYLIKHYNILSRLLGAGERIYGFEKLFDDDLGKSLLNRSAQLVATWVYGIWIYNQAPLRINIYGDLICNPKYRRLIYTQLQDFGISKEIIFDKV